MLGGQIKVLSVRERQDTVVCGVRGGTERDLGNKQGGLSIRRRKEGGLSAGARSEGRLSINMYKIRRGRCRKRLHQGENSE